MQGNGDYNFNGINVCVLNLEIYWRAALCFN